MKLTENVLPTVVIGAAMAVAILWANRGQADAPPGQYTIINGTVYDTKTTLKWEQIISTTSYSWGDAKTYCANLGLDGGGWRLPSVKELQTIVDETKKNPATDQVVFPNTPSQRFWTSSPATDSSRAQSVAFDFGYTSIDIVSIPNMARCVR